MFIRKILIKNFRHLQDVELGPFSFPPRGSDLMALAGPNGGGKSSILECLNRTVLNEGLGETVTPVFLTAGVTGFVTHSVS